MSPGNYPTLIDRWRIIYNMVGAKLENLKPLIFNNNVFIF